LVLSIGAIALFSTIAGPQGFLSWGWRVPQLLSAVLIGVGLYVRLGILETPAFSQLVTRQKVERQPVLEAVRTQGKNVVLTCLIRMSQHSSFYLFTTFFTAYAVATLKISRPLVLTAVLVGGLVSLFTVLFWGYLSDVIGRKRMYMIGAVTMLVFAIPYFLAIDTAIAVVVFVAVILSLIIHDMQYGPQAAFIAESFPTKVRYSGSSLGYQLSSITAAGPAPLIATFLAHTFNSGLAVGVYLVIWSAIAIGATALLKDTSKVEYMAEEGEPVPPGAATQGTT
jgi:MFS family permease